MKNKISVQTFKSSGDYSEEVHLFILESRGNPTFWSKGSDTADYAGELYRNIVKNISSRLRVNVRYSIVCFTNKDLNNISTKKLIKTINNITKSIGKKKRCGSIVVGDNLAVKLNPQSTYRFLNRFLVNSDSNVPFLPKISGNLSVPTCVTVPSYIWCKDAGPKDSGPNLVGMVIRAAISVLTGKEEGSIAKFLLEYHKELSYVVVDTRKKFIEFMDSIQSAHVLSIDTETVSLNRIQNRVLTLQITAADKKQNIKVWSLPLEHKDTPWDGKQFKIIKKKLRSFFESNKALHVYQNAKYDLHQLMSLLGLRYYAGRVYDTQAGEFSLEENGKFANSFLYTSENAGYYSLEMIEGRYGYDRPKNVVIGKSDRAHMERFSIEEISQYGCIDTVSPYYIMLEQCRIAKARGYKKFEQLVTDQIGCMIIAMTVMEHNGIPVDTDYLSEISSPQGELNNEIIRIAEEFSTTEAAKKVNKRLAKNVNFSEDGLFGKVDTPNLFSIRDQEHLQMLFFGVLKLSPLKQNKDGSGSIGKTFQNRYRHNPQVSIFTKYQKVTKLKSSFADAINNFMVKHPDMRLDKRLRPVFSFLRVLTGRSCFVADTPITVCDKSINGYRQIPIKDVKKGDIVLSVDTKDKYRLCHQRVLKSWKTGVRKLVRVNLQSKSGGSPIEIYTTIDHRFMLSGFGWREAGQLRKGDKLYGCDIKNFKNHSQPMDSIYTVSSVKIDTGMEEDVYDLEIEDTHNFFAHKVCVHNSTSDPSTQQIPQHGPQAKIIKKQFRARKGSVLMKADYSGHEVRVSGNLGEDPAICDTVDRVNKALFDYRIASADTAIELVKELGRKSDLHIQNAKTFFGKDIDKDDPLRHEAKSAVFSVLYSASARNVGSNMLEKHRTDVEDEVYSIRNKDKLSEKDLEFYKLKPGEITDEELRRVQKLEQEVAYLYSKEAEEEFIDKAEKLLKALFTAWEVLADFIDEQQKIAKKNNVVFGPHGRPRHLWGYVYPNKSIGSGMDRRVFNSISQGFASDIGYVGIYLMYTFLYEKFTSRGYVSQIRQCNAVHDSSMSELPYPALPLAIYLQEHSMLTLNYTYYREKFGIKPKTLYGFDVECGINEAELSSYNTRPQDLPEYIKQLGIEADMPKSMIKKAMEDAKTIGKLRLRELKKKDHEYCGLNSDKVWDNIIPSLNMWKMIEKNYDEEGNYLNG